MRIADVFELSLENWVEENRGRLVKVNGQEHLYLDIAHVTWSAQYEAMVVFCSFCRDRMHAHQQRDITMITAV